MQNTTAVYSVADTRIMNITCFNTGLTQRNVNNSSGTTNLDNSLLFSPHQNKTLSPAKHSGCQLCKKHQNNEHTCPL